MDLSSSSPSAGQSVTFHDYADIRNRIDRRLADLLPWDAHKTNPVALAAREAVLAGGKRVRSILLVLAARGLGNRSQALLDLGCAVEMVHTASLILDDMPCMDDASLRRGRTTTHRRFGEDVAILSAVALLTKAFSVITSTQEVAPAIRSQMVGQLADAVGMQGLVRGQYQDLHECDRPGPASITSTNTLKTGMLFEASVAMAALAADTSDAVTESLRRFAQNLGQAFQLLDDLTDGSSGNGKDASQDEGKATLVALLGKDKAQQCLATYLDEADAHLTAVYGPGQPVSHFMRELFRRGDSTDRGSSTGTVAVTTTTTNTTARNAPH